MRGCKILFRLLLTIVLLTAASCSSPEDANAAKFSAYEARDYAVEAGAPSHAPQLWEKAESGRNAAEALLEQHKYKEATAKWMEVRDAYRAAAEYARNQQRLMQAEAEYRNELSKYSIARLRRYGGEVWLQITVLVEKASGAGNDFDSAIEAYNEARRLLPAADEAARRGYIESLLEIARKNDNEHNARAALDALEPLLELDPEHEEGLRLQESIMERFLTLVVPDQYQTIQEAINAASPGQIVRIKPGTYVESLVFKAGIHLKGDGTDKVFLRADADKHIVFVEKCTSGTISGIAFEHINHRGAKFEYGLITVIRSKVDIHDCILRKSGNSGIYAMASQITIRDCITEHNEGAGLEIWYAGTEAIVERVTARFNKMYGIYLNEKVSAEVNECEVRENAMAGVAVFGAQTEVAVKKTIAVKNMSGLHIALGAEAVLDDNKTIENRGDGIRMTQGARATSANNTCEKNGECGILVIGEGTYATLKDNTCNENKYDGIFIGRGAQASAEGLTCERNGRNGISVYHEKTKATVNKNKCRENGLHGIFFGFGATGVAEDNICERNSSCGIITLDNRSSSELRNNRVTANKHHGLAVQGTAVTVAEGNIVTDNGIYGAMVDQKDTSATLRDNQFLRNGLSGVAFRLSSGIVEGNTIEGNKEYGILISNEGTIVRIVKNTLNDNAEGDIKYKDGATPHGPEDELDNSNHEAGQ